MSEIHDRRVFGNRRAERQSSQFYAVWPIGLIAIMRLTKRVELVLMALIGGVTVAAAYYLKMGASGVFFLAPFRVNEFLIGGLVVFLERYNLNNFF